jgi:uncharacterized membrane protein (DUF485 family)
MTDQEVFDRIERDPRYAPLVRRRARFAWLLAALVLVAFTAFMLVIALDKKLFATPIGTLTMSWGIPAGFCMIGLAITVIAIFTVRANREFDPAMAAIIADAKA